MTNPYRGLENFRFWSRGVALPAPGHVDPMIGACEISPAHRVATMGSCFAQHLARHIKASGLNYYVAETAPAGLAPEVAESRNFGVFSARYGNIYTVRQAVQLFDRAFGRFAPSEDVWEREGRYVDAFRPQIEPDGFETPDQVRQAAAEHLAFVRSVFAESDWLVFTLGLTEAWRSRLDGAVYPLAPGVSGGDYDPARHEFVNFTAAEVNADLGGLIERIQAVNPAIRILLTVSPVPLIATWEKRHVLVSTSVSKAILRVAADEAERRFDAVTYFPSYEIITSPAADGRYFADDLRQVTELGVKHVMRVFSRHFIPTSPEAARALSGPAAAQTLVPNKARVCDEEAIEAVAQATGFDPP